MIVEVSYKRTACFLSCHPSIVRPISIVHSLPSVCERQCLITQSISHLSQYMQELDLIKCCDLTVVAHLSLVGHTKERKETASQRY